MMMAARSVFFLLIPSLFFLHFFPCQLDRENWDGQQLLPSSLPSRLKRGETE